MCLIIIKWKKRTHCKSCNEKKNLVNGKRCYTCYWMHEKKIDLKKIKNENNSPRRLIQ